MDVWGQPSSRCPSTTWNLGWCATKECSEIQLENIPPGQRPAEASVLSSQLTQALSIIQGVALTHNSTKSFLGRKYPLDVCDIHSEVFTLVAHPKHPGVTRSTYNFA